MKAIILAGGYGSRISEETFLKPKPMIEIGDKPILWHIMKIYSTFNINDFIICLGYKGYQIKEYFKNYLLHNSDITVDIKHDKIQIAQNNIEPWSVTLVDTGDNTMTGGRIKRVGKYLEETFCLTYGDGVGNVNIQESINFHKKNKFLMTMTVVQTVGRFGSVEIDSNRVIRFQEKPNVWINAGFFVCEPQILDYIKNDDTILEREPLEKLAKEGKLGSFKHENFWHAMDTLRDKKLLDDLWSNKKAPWKIW